MLPWFGDFDNEAENSNDIMRSVWAKDSHSHRMHPVYAAVGLHNAKLTGSMRGTIRPERLHGDRIESAPICRMHTLQEQMKVSRRVMRNSEDVPQLV
jgi:hypothetical protein